MIRVASAIVGIAVPARTNSDAWWIGALFGAVVLVWDARTARDLIRGRAAGFLAASTAVFMSVAWYAGWAMMQQARGLRHPPVSPLFVAVFAGGALLVSAHAALLGLSWRRAAVAIPGIFAVWYLQLRALDLLGTVDLGVLIATWQAIYLMFTLEVPSHPSRAERSRTRVSSSAIAC